MKCLLMNEASGVHHYLRQGLQHLGHEVTLAMSGSRSYQGRSADVYFGHYGASFPAKFVAEIKEHITPWNAIRPFYHYDVVNFIMGISAFPGLFNRYRDLPLLKRHGLRLSYLGLGCDEVSLLRVRPDRETMPCASCMAYDQIGRDCKKQVLDRRAGASRYAPLFDFSVSPVYEYDHSHAFFPNARHARIPFPINVASIPFCPLKPKRTPLMVHSPTRRGFKGTHIILEAIEKLKARTEDFTFRIVEDLPHAEYLQVMQEADIYIDQTLGESQGIAALENLAMGKIVFSGNSPLAQSYFPFVSECPVVDAPPDADALADALFCVLRAKDEFEALSRRGRAYVAQYHDHIQIAQEYVNLWQSEP